MPIFRKHNKKQDFTILDNKLINDKTLSFRARGVLAYLLSKPQTWEAKIPDLVANSGKEGLNAIQTVLKELREARYLILRRGEFRDDNNERKLGSWYDVYEEPQPEGDSTP